ncbi:hypothetical protein [Bartonella machadoae]|uniref:hypothetical protein n=1 Tax=Bartonella machadoae TaxID=2893471 RepID=UPI001F4CA97A|nr:hypothetical protein [Bartonella machadoae]UNE53375.1 hypothetical protein LNM86_06665 [Bartonella machadoae]
MEKKYELTDEEIEFDGYVTLYRIRALRDFGDVKAGDLGGFIEDEDNLSHENDCWIYNDAKAYYWAKIYDSAKIFDNAQISDSAEIFGNAKIYNNVKIYGGHIFGSTQIYGNVIIDNDSRIYGNTKIYDNSEACNQTMTAQNGDSSTEFDNPF